MKYPLRNKRTFYDDYDFCWLPEVKHDEEMIGGKNAMSEINNNYKQDNDENNNNNSNKNNETTTTTTESSSSLLNQSNTKTERTPISFRSTKQMNKTTELLKSYIQAAKNVSPL